MLTLLALALLAADDGIMCVGIPSNPRFTSVTATTVTGTTGKFDVLDAGTLNVEGAVGIAGPIVSRATTGTALKFDVGAQGLECTTLGAVMLKNASLTLQGTSSGWTSNTTYYSS